MVLSMLQILLSLTMTEQSRIVDTKGVKTNEFKLKMKSFREKYQTLKVELE